MRVHICTQICIHVYACVYAHVRYEGGKVFLNFCLCVYIFVYWYVSICKRVCQHTWGTKEHINMEALMDERVFASFITQHTSSHEWKCLCLMRSFLMYERGKEKKAVCAREVRSNGTLIHESLNGEVQRRRGGGLGSSTIFKNLMSPTPRREWYLTTGRRFH